MIPKVISLSNFPKKGLYFKGDVPLDVGSFQRGYVHSINSIVLEIEIKKFEKIFILKGFLEEKISLFCSRCLEPFPFNLKIDIFHRLEEKEDPEADAFFIENGIFKPYDMVYELIDINLPMKPLCSENCKGLCSLCGANLNFEGCDCPKNYKRS